MADQYAATLLSSVLARWVVVCITVYSKQIDSSIPVAFHIYEWAVMEESTGLFITSLCFLFIMHPSCLSFLHFFLPAYPLPHCAILPLLLLPSLFIPLFIPLSPLHISLSCVGPTPLHLPTDTPTPQHLCFSSALHFSPLPLIVLCFFCSLLSVHLSLYPPLQEEAGAKGWMDAWMDGRCLDGWVGRWVDVGEEGREE